MDLHPFRSRRSRQGPSRQADRWVRGAALTGYAEVAAEQGLDARAMLRRFDIDSRVLSDSELRLPVDKVVDLVNQSAFLTGCETFGLRMTAYRQLSHYGPAGLVLAHQPTLRAAMASLIRYQRMLNGALVLQIEDFSDDLVLVRQELLAGGCLRQAYEVAVGTIFGVFGRPSGPRLHAASVHFAHKAPRDRGYHRDVFGQGVEFGSDFNGIIIRRQDFDAPSPSADAGLVRHAERFLQALPYSEDCTLATEVQKAIQVLLPLDGASIVSVSGRLGLSPRTLQRRLAEEGADFSGLLNEIRRTQAVRHLDALHVPLAQVAALVGYARETSFARWFAAEFGVAPSEWRLNPR